VEIAIDCRPRLDDSTSRALAAGDAVSVSGDLITIRDATARRLVEMAAAGERLPIDLAGRLSTRLDRRRRGPARSSGPPGRRPSNGSWPISRSCLPRA
jgi:tartrate dehydratase beta subunit/fumarate hydratase class I family protein